MSKRMNKSLIFVIISLVFIGVQLKSLQIKEPVSIADTAAHITADCDSTKEKSMAVYRYMTRYFRYDCKLRDAIVSKEIVKHVSDPQQTLNNHEGICCDLAVLYAAMLESQGIEVEIEKGYYNGVYHAWNRVYEEETGTWMQVDVTSDLWRGRWQTEWPGFDSAQYTVSGSIDYSGLTPLTFGSGRNAP